MGTATRRTDPAVGPGPSSRRRCTVRVRWHGRASTQAVMAAGALASTGRGLQSEAPARWHRPSPGGVAGQDPDPGGEGGGSTSVDWAWAPVRGTQELIYCCYHRRAASLSVMTMGRAQQPEDGPRRRRRRRSRDSNESVAGRPEQLADVGRSDLALR